MVIKVFIVFATLISVIIAAPRPLDSNLPECKKEDFKTFWPDYSDKQFYYQCIDIGQAFRLKCSNKKFFDFNIQKCVNEDEWSGYPTKPTEPTNTTKPTEPTTPTTPTAPTASTAPTGRPTPPTEPSKSTGTVIPTLPSTMSTDSGPTPPTLKPVPTQGTGPTKPPRPIPSTPLPTAPTDEPIN